MLGRHISFVEPVRPSGQRLLRLLLLPVFYIQENSLLPESLPALAKDGGIREHGK